MIELIQANWIAFVTVALLAVLIALWIVGRAKKPRDRSYRPDVLDEGVGPARRNQALIDSPSAAPSVTHETQPPSTPETLAGAGTAVAAAVLANEPGVDEDAALGHRQIDLTAKPLAPDDQLPDTPEDAEAVAAAIKIAIQGVASDDLSKIKGVGPKLVALLGDLGISSYDQIAAWNDEDVMRIDAQMGAFKGRIERDNWREQARFLASGDTAGYEERFGKL